MEYIITLMSDPQLSGVVVATLIGCVAYLLRNIPNYILGVLNHLLFISLVVYSEDDAFEVVNYWLSKNKALKYARNLRLSSQWDSGSRLRVLSFGLGWNIAFYKKRMIFIRRIQHTESISYNRRETFIISVPCISQKIIEEFLNDARDLSLHVDQLEVRYYSDYWHLACRRSHVLFDNLCIDDETKQNIINDIDRFLANKTQFNEKGVPYRRGYLLSGEPGGGKTTLATAIASYLRWPIYVMNLGSITDDKILHNAFISVPPNSVILIEDIDAAGISESRFKSENNDDKSTSLTLSGLLNSIDGVATPENYILVMTTNRCNVLDPALLRPGRTDQHFELKRVDKYTGIKWLSSRNPEAAEMIAESINWPATVAEIQNTLTKWENGAS